MKENVVKRNKSVNRLLHLFLSRSYCPLHSPAPPHLCLSWIDRLARYPASSPEFFPISLAPRCQISRLVVVNRAVSASTVGTSALSGLYKSGRQHVPRFLVMSVKEEQKEGEPELSSDIENAISDNFGIDRDLVGSFGETEYDRVSGPEGEGHPSEEVEQTSGPAGSERGSLRTVDDEDIPNTKEEGATNGKETPSGDFTIVPSSRGKTAKKTSDDHTDIKEDGEEAVSGAQTAKESERDQKKGSGE